MSASVVVDREELRRDPEGVLRRLRADSDGSPDADALLERVETWVEQRKRINGLRRAKQEAAVAFRSIHTGPMAVDQLKARMKQAVDAFAAAEQRLRQMEDELFAAEPGRRVDAVMLPLPERFISRAPAGQSPLNLTFERLSAGNRNEWDAFVSCEPRASMYHFSRWESLVTDVMKQHSLCTLARVEGKVVGVLPLYVLRSRLFGNFAVSIPYMNYGGPLGINEGIEAALLERARIDVEAQGLNHMEIRELRARDGWPVRTDKVSMLRALPSSINELENQLGAKLRSQIRRAAREGFDFRVGTEARLLEDFYRVFARNMRDLGTPVYSVRMFAEILRLWPGNAKLVVAFRGRKPVGGAFLLRFNDTMEVPWASTLREFNGVALNMQMYWHVLCHAIEIGCKYFDFGRSTNGSGTFRFKKQWGALPVCHYWNYGLQVGQQLPGLSPDNPRFRFLVSCWKRLPVPISRILGPTIVRALP